MDKSGNLKEFNKLYLQVRRTLKHCGYDNMLLPNEEDFSFTLKKFIELLEGHKKILTAIGKL